MRPLALSLILLAALLSLPACGSGGGPPAVTVRGAAGAMRGAGSASASPASPPAAARKAPAPPLGTLRRVVEQAKSRTFYFILDPGSGTLTLGYRGATARTWPVSRVETGTRRILFVGSGDPAAVGGTVWTGGRLEPPRNPPRPLLEVDSQGTPQGPEPPAIPPAPEEAVPAPARYWIRFEEGLTVEIVAGDGAGEGSFLSSLASGLGERWRDARHALGAGGSAPRLRLILPAADAGSLYRGIPAGASLLITES